MNKMLRSISRMLVVIFILTSTILVYPNNGFAAHNEKKENKVFEQNRDKTEIIVKYKTSGKQKDVAARVKGKQRLAKFNIKKSFKMSRVDLVEIDKADDIEKTVAELKKDPDVEYAQPNYKLNIASVSIDARFSDRK